MEGMAFGDEATLPMRPRKLSFLDLPIETQREIISHCSQSDLVCVSLVSSHFRELAAAILYRNFHIIFPDDDDLTFDSPIDGLAGGLDTFTTSDYNYAKHLRDLSMDTLSAGVKGELSYQPYLYSASCGKFLNTLLHLTLRKAKSLEVFKWNIRVELSRQVYRELHRIPSLRTLHLRMQAGDSYYIPPPPLPMTTDTHGPASTVHWGHAPSLHLPTIPSAVSLPLTGSPPPLHAGPPPALAPPSKSLPKKASKREQLDKEPSTLAGFSNLRSLSVLDIDDLDIVSELKSCVINSSSSLRDLQLSLSDSLASQARRPQPDSDPEDSDADDDFHVGIGLGNPPSGFGPDPTGPDSNAPAKALRAQEERKIHEAILGRIFGAELPMPLEKTIKTEKVPKDGYPNNGRDAESGEPSSRDPHHQFVSSLRSLTDGLMTSVHGTQSRSEAHQETLEMIEKAAKRYVAFTDLQMDPDGNTRPSGEAGLSLDPGTYQGDGGNTHTQDTYPDTGDDSKAAPIDMGEAAPEEIDTEYTGGADDVNLELDDKKTSSRSEYGPAASTMNQVDPEAAEAGQKFHEAQGSTTSPSSDPGRHANMARGAEQVDLLQRKLRSLRGDLDDMRSDSHDLHTDNFQSHVDDISSLETRVRELEAFFGTASSETNTVSKTPAMRYSTQDSKPATAGKTHQQCVFDYLRETRGFSLQSLSIHLIPAKASVLSRAIDLGSLRQLTLLNVGSQSPIWTLLSKENKVKPLSLRSVYTDNVSDAFLSCMSQLEELHELYMLERSAKSKPESLAPRSTNTIDQIRRTVLSKHMPTIKRLMIKDESHSSSWDANEKAMIHICTRGKQLEELAVSMNIQAVHAFMQYLPGLPKLRALHILRFKNNDTCIWVMREILRFIVDSLSHYPQNRLEWIAMEDDRVDRVVRSPPDEDRQKRERKGKQAARAPAAPEIYNPSFPVLPSLPLGSDSDSDSEDEGTGHGAGLRFRTVGPMQFYDVWGVKIFEKEIRSGRL